MPAFELFGLLMGVINAIAGAQSQAAANQMNIALNRENREDQQQFAQEAAETANRVTSQQYMNLYSPQAKVNQLRHAGLSVGLAYEGLGGAGGTAAQAATPSATPPVVNPLLQMGSIMDAVQGMMSAAQTENTQKDTEKKGQEIANMQKELEEIESKIKMNIATEINTRLQSKLAELDLQIKTETKGDQIKLIRKQVEAIEQSVDEAKERIAGLKIENKHKDEYITKELNVLGAQYAKLVQDTILVKAEKLLTDAKTKLTDEQTKLTEQQKIHYQKLIQEVEQQVRIQKQRANHYQTNFWMMEKSGDWKVTGILMGMDGLNEFVEGDWVTEHGRDDGWRGVGRSF